MNINSPVDQKVKISYMSTLSEKKDSSNLNDYWNRQNCLTGLCKEITNIVNRIKNCLQTIHLLK